jgi:simple sugar transport system ATP-binding protein
VSGRRVSQTVLLSTVWLEFSIGWASMTVSLKLENISKRFGPNLALKSVNFEVKAGEIHGLVGENGSGKSTLLNILMGHPVIAGSGGYTGCIYLDDKRVEIRSPGDAIGLGLGMVHQEFALIDDFTVGQNIRIGSETLFPLTERFLGRNLGMINSEADCKLAAAYLKTLGTDLDPHLRPANLPVSLRQYAEIAREVGRRDLRVLILDEPTAVLGAEEAGRLLAVLRQLAQKGTAIIFVSHKLEEVVAVSDRVTVLRDGAVAACLSRQDDDFRPDRIAWKMVGKNTAQAKRRGKNNPGAALLKFVDWGVDMPGETIKNLYLEVRQGEVLGIAGLSGHGKIALGYGLMGMYPTTGRVLMTEAELKTSDPLSVLDEDICFLPDDRRLAGLLLRRSIVENIIFTATQRKGRFQKYSLGPLSTIDWKGAEKYARGSVDKLDIRCQDVHQATGLLSGGNQQKVCLARALALEPKVLIVAEPTRGIDIGAKQVILDALLKINHELGTSIVCISSELSDLRQISDRIAIMYDGGVIDELTPEATDAEFAFAFSGKRSRRDAAN